MTSFPQRRRCRRRRTVFMESGRSEGSSRAVGAQPCASVAQTARACSALWNSLELRGQRGAFTQPELAIAWLAGAISPPNLFHPWRRGHRRNPSGLEPGGAAQLPKAVVHLHNSGINALLISSVAQVHRATTASCGTHPQRQRTDNNLRQSAVPSTTATGVLGKAEQVVCSRILRQLSDDN